MKRIPTFVALLILYGLIALCYVDSVPVGEGVDEIHHFDYTNFIAHNLRLPMHRWETDKPEVVMVHHPPLYYLLTAPLVKLFDTGDRTQVIRANPHFRWDEEGRSGWRVMMIDSSPTVISGTLQAIYALRILNILIGSIALVAIYRSMQWLLPQQPWVVFGAVAITAFNPSFIYTASTVHHDILLVALYSLGLCWALRHLSQPLHFSGLVAGGVLVGAASLTKLTGITLALVILPALLLRQRGKEEWRSRMLQIGTIYAVAFFVAGWWYIRNDWLYGDFSGQGLFESNHAHMLRATPLTWGLFKVEVLGQLEKTFWGAFGFMHILLPTWLRRIVWGSVLFALLGWLPVVWKGIRGSRPTNQTALRWTTLLLAFAAMAAVLIRFAFFASGSGHGRYLLPAATTVSAVLAIGINRFSKARWQKLVNISLAGVMATYAIGAPTRYVWPKYQPAPAISQDEVQQATPLNLNFEKGITLLAIQSNKSIVLPGEGLAITTYWHANRAIQPIADAYVQMNLIDQAGIMIASSAFWPEIESTPAVWKARVIANQQSFYISPQQTSGKVTVQIEVKEGKEGPSLPIVGLQPTQTSISVLELPTLGAVVAIPESALPLLRRDEIFAAELQLVAVLLPEEQHAGDLLPIGLFWHVLKQVSQDYTVFVHILDQQGNIVAQLDRPPGGGTLPTSSWQSGQLLQDTYPLSLPADLPTGTYRVRIGLYTWPELTRQPITLNETMIGDSLIIGTFTLTGN